MGFRGRATETACEGERGVKKRCGGWDKRKFNEMMDKELGGSINLPKTRNAERGKGEDNGRLKGLGSIRKKDTSYWVVRGTGGDGGGVNGDL